MTNVPRLLGNGNDLRQGMKKPRPSAPPGPDGRGWSRWFLRGVPGGEPTPAPHRRREGEELPARKEAHNKSHKQVRARVEHVFARMKCWKILRDCPLRGEGVRHAMRGIARLHDLNLVG